ncbi:uncharacterized protein LOC144907109 [Branchiostoma floridae x Branchiostoma belcheri]
MPKQLQGVEKYFFSIKRGVSQDWKNLADCLGLWDEVRNIDGRNSDDESRCRDMLGVWRRRKGNAATTEVLVEALSTIGLQKVVDDLRREYPELASPQDSNFKVKTEDYEKLETNSGKKRKRKRNRKRRRKSDHLREEDSSNESNLSVKGDETVDMQACSETVIAGVSSKWDDLARKLGFSENQIDGIQDSKKDQDHQCREMLRRWRDRDGRKATLQVLQQALIDIGERLTAESLEGAFAICVMRESTKCDCNITYVFIGGQVTMLNNYNYFSIQHSF